MVKIKELPTEFKSAISIPQMYAINSNTASWNRSFYIGSLYQNVIFLINRVSKIWNNGKLVGVGGYLGDGELELDHGGRNLYWKLGKVGWGWIYKVTSCL